MQDTKISLFYSRHEKKKKIKALGKKGLQVTERQRWRASVMSAQARNLTLVKPVLECFEKQKKCSHCLGDTGFEGVTVDFNPMIVVFWLCIWVCGAQQNVAYQSTYLPIKTKA